VALMKFREPNQVKWLGWRPAHRGTQILQQGIATNATTIVYTVPPGQTFYLTAFHFSCSTAIVGNGRAEIFNGVAVQQVLGFLRVITAAGWVPVCQNSYRFPLELPAGWVIRAISAIAAFTVTLGIHGWVE